MAQSVEINDRKWHVVGQVLAVAVSLGTIGFGGANAVGVIFGGSRLAHSPSIVIAGDILTIDGKQYKVVTSQFTPKGKFTIGKKYFDSVNNVEAFPFLVEDWRKMDDRNELKSRIAQREKKTGVAQSVAYALHAGSRSYGCVTLPQSQLDEFKQNLEGRSIEIK